MTFTYINENQIDDELKCTICADPFRSPMNCLKCGNTYCQPCISKWMEKQTSCPSCRDVGSQFQPVISRVVLNQLNRLLVQCKLCQQVNIQRSNFSDHISTSCPKQIISCTNNCGWKGCREKHEQHFIECERKRLQRKNISQWRMPILVLILGIVYWFIFLSGSTKK